mmetsp:Transcript_102052/g.288179  ORF Transcript_102052/g.288179 Transcript_102052/m.288179 type:complete len:200 (+) Transcript_102052:1553-2152(+)
MMRPVGVCIAPVPGPGKVPCAPQSSLCHLDHVNPSSSLQTTPLAQPLIPTCCLSWLTKKSAMRWPLEFVLTSNGVGLPTHHSGEPTAAATSPQLCPPSVLRRTAISCAPASLQSKLLGGLRRVSAKATIAPVGVITAAGMRKQSASKSPGQNTVVRKFDTSATCNSPTPFGLKKALDGTRSWTTARPQDHAAAPPRLQL